jgi:dihydrolipoamide dehydrogenase
MYDLIVIGGGPGGGDGAEKAVKAGLKTLLVEKRFLGGVCLNEGCIPSKTLLFSSKIYSHALHGEQFGVTCGSVTFNMKRVMERKNKIVETLRKSSESSKKRLGITVVAGKGTILQKAGDTFRVQAGSDIFEGKRLLIASGSEAIRPPLPGADQEFVMTNREILEVQSVPGKLVVIGGGVIGLELANFFAEAGSAVTVIELLPQIAGPLENEIRQILQRELEKKGIVFKLRSKVSSIGNHSVTWQTEGQEKTETADADIVLMSVGRRPVVKDIGLENINVFVERGAIVNNNQGRTNIPGVWAAGDVNGKCMLAHKASRESAVCVRDMIGEHDIIRYSTIPSVIYTHPEVASIGLKDDEAAAQGYDVAVAKMPFTFSGRFFAEMEQGDRSLCKVVLDKKTKTILGVHTIGLYSSEIIAAAIPIIENELRVEDVEELVFPHPTVGEIIKETIVSSNL